MHVAAAGESAAQLPWLWPDADSLRAIANPHSPPCWSTLRADPAALLLLQRHRSDETPAADRPGIGNAARQTVDPRLLNTALHWYRFDRGVWLDWRRPLILPYYRTALTVAHYAVLLAESTRCCNPRAAWTAGLFAPLGWFAIAAIDPALAARCLTDPQFADDPLATQTKLWGLDHSAIAARLIERWRLPRWVAAAYCDEADPALDPPDAAARLRAVIKLATLLAEREGYRLGLGRPAEEAELLARLSLEPADLNMVCRRFRSVELGEVFERPWNDPRRDEGLPARLKGALERRQAEAAPFIEPLARDLDRVHRALVEARTNEDERLRSAKLEALAEFAAGASHEINNPLAVVRGQSQYLLNRTPDEASRKALESIVRQTQRIHAILTELMQFARPPRPNRQLLSLGETIRQAAEQYRTQAREAGIQMACPPTDDSIAVEGDARQLQTAIGSLIRNAIEAAAPGKGWVRIGVEVDDDEARVWVEDSGPGPASIQREHMFDPFYCGRTAGRGRGLGLPIAWRLAQQHGGDVRFDPIPGGPTRFVLSLPLAGPVDRRLSA